jgi:hypothetical protein
VVSHGNVRDIPTGTGEECVCACIIERESVCVFISVCVLVSVCVCGSRESC